MANPTENAINICISRMMHCALYERAEFRIFFFQDMIHGDLANS